MLTLTSIKKTAINTSEKKKIKNKLCINVINYARLKHDVARSVKKDKNNFINIIGNIFTMHII